MFSRLGGLASRGVSAGVGALGTGGVIALAAAGVVMHLKSLAKSIGETVGGFKQIASTIVTANASAAIKGFVGIIQGASRTLGTVIGGPLLGALASKVVGLANRFVDGLDALVASLGRYNPVVAMHARQYEVQQKMFRIKAANAFGGLMAEWLKFKAGVLDLVASLLPAIKVLISPLVMIGKVLNWFVGAFKTGAIAVVAAFSWLKSALLGNVRAFGDVMKEVREQFDQSGLANAAAQYTGDFLRAGSGLPGQTGAGNAAQGGGNADGSGNGPRGTRGGSGPYTPGPPPSRGARTVPVIPSGSSYNTAAPSHAGTAAATVGSSSLGAAVAGPFGAVGGAIGGSLSDGSWRDALRNTAAAALSGPAAVGVTASEALNNAFGQRHNKYISYRINDFGDPGRKGPGKPFRRYSRGIQLGAWRSPIPVPPGRVLPNEPRTPQEHARWKASVRAQNVGTPGGYRSPFTGDPTKVRPSTSPAWMRALHNAFGDGNPDGLLRGYKSMDPSLRRGKGVAGPRDEARRIAAERSKSPDGGGGGPKLPPWRDAAYDRMKAMENGPAAAATPQLPSNFVSSLRATTPLVRLEQQHRHEWRISNDKTVHEAVAQVRDKMLNGLALAGNEARLAAAMLDTSGDPRMM